MFIELEEHQSAEINAFNSEDFRRLQKTIHTIDGVEVELLCITFKNGDEILFNEKYDEVMGNIR